ncbi:MAG: prefoldin subunit [Candidatus Woesearchaeota archaeon]
MTDRKQALKKIQEAEQSMQSMLQQKQAFLGQKAEVEEAIAELESSDVAYQIIANIMVRKDSKSILDNLNDQKELISLRIKSIEGQEEKLKEQIKEYQESVMKGD